MPLQGPGHFKENVRTLMHEVGKSPHVQSREQALAIAYAKERGRQEGGSVQARLKRAPNREMPNRPAPIRDLPDFPMSENIEDRRGDIAGSLWSGLKDEWGHFPGRAYRYQHGGEVAGLVNHDQDPELPRTPEAARLVPMMPLPQGYRDPAYIDVIQRLIEGQRRLNAMQPAARESLRRYALGGLIRHFRQGGLV
jgi:hypothetical protein